MSVKTERIASSLQKEISDIVANEIRDDNIKNVTVTHLKLATDLSYAKIYFTTFFDTNKEIVGKSLNKAKGFIKSELCKRKFQIRIIPELEFIYDDSIAYGEHIEKIIKKLHNE